ncbi:exosporium glycoprotein BclB-related protein [Sporosarcina thermotolerans]|uniref:Exosporium glycoprotein BclB-related protein n=1 Tax=Sporosarcina thermotolerans TaxID=633404 RepID=A0AAW9AGM9_9BACL|nr:exosporium glycoprotein BclB-related protein [Sporosarcina thermotolerans]MDW0118813.1 exosporium glycoprotein BclB-related protein [Sporosarcina thermotolerans]WHT48503.1 exosporium glycoprotein BclB-related protein [Sporosarcina thermotolerans]
MACFQGGGCGGGVAGCCGNNNGIFQNRCHTLGPILAVDQNCLPPATAPTAPAAQGSIIPFASGAVPVALTTVAGGVVGVPFFLGFGTAVPGTITGGVIVLPTVGGLLNEAFTVPRPGTITSISATFTITVALTLAPTATVRAQIYQAPAGSDTFSPTAAFVDLTPQLTTGLAVGSILTGSAAAAVPVATGDRLLMVFTLLGVTVIAAVTGTASAGIAIA